MTTGLPDAAALERARLALRYILCNDAITAPIPGLVHARHVDNCLAAIAERLAAEGATVVVADLNPSADAPPRVTFQQCDVTCAARMRSRRARRRILPTLVLGSSLRNSTWRGIL